MGAHVKLSGSWSNVSDIYARVGGSWKEVTEGYVKLSGAWKQFFSAGTPLTVNFLVIAGGAGGGGGGGGAGGYRTSAGTSGGGASAESALTLAVATNYTVTVGAGGTAGNGGTGTLGGAGGSSVFSTITATGGGGGGGDSLAGATGGSGGGGGFPASGTGTISGGSGTANQGFAGGYGQRLANGGGGGSSAVGQNANQRGTDTGGNGGNGVASSITGTSITRGGGGGGVSWSASGAVGGSGGGGNGAYSVTTGGSAGTVNTGGGGGGSWSTAFAGGSGVVIIKYPDFYAISVSAGLNHMTTTSGGFRITQFLAGTGTVSFSEAVASDYELIGSVYLSSSQASVTFDLTGLSSTYKHLQIRGVARTDRSGADSDPVILQFNGDTAGNYTRHGLGAYRFGGSGTVYSNSATSQTSIMVTENMPVSSSTANVFGVFVTDILDPFQTTKNKTVRTLNGMNAAWTSIELRSGAWLSTTAASSILLKPLVGANFVANSRFSIYGLKG